MSTISRFADLLRKLQAARLAEAEALGELAAALAAPSPESLRFPLVVPYVSPAELEPCYLSVRQLAERIPYAPQTIRNLMSTGDLVEGRHYFKRRGRVMFSWPAMRAWVEAQAAPHVEALPLVRNRRNGRSQ